MGFKYSFFKLGPNDIVNGAMYYIHCVHIIGNYHRLDMFLYFTE